MATIEAPVSQPDRSITPQLQLEDEAAAPWTSATLLTVSALCLGYALQIKDGEYTPAAFFWVVLSVAACGLGAALGGSRWHSRPMVIGVLWLSVTLQCWLLLTRQPALLELSHPAQIHAFIAGIVAAAALAGAAMHPPAWLAKWVAPALLLVYLLVGFWVIRMTPSATSDVRMLQERACRLLLEGKLPYGGTTPNIYGPNTSFYSPEMLDNQGGVRVGYTYLPLTIFLTLPGYLAGDFRYSHLAAIFLAGASIAYARPGAVATLAAALLLFTPRSFYVLQAGWVETYVVMLLTAMVFCAMRAPKLLPWVFGLLLASKQYNVLMLPVALLLIPRPLRMVQIVRFYGIAIGVAVAVTAPMALLNLRAFWWDTAGFRALPDRRPDSLSLPVWAGDAYADAPWGWLALAVATGAIALSLWRLPSRPWGFAASMGFVFVCLFAVSIKSHINYYYLVIGCLSCAIGAAVPTDKRSTSG